MSAFDWKQYFGAMAEKTTRAAILPPDVFPRQEQLRAAVEADELRHEDAMEDLIQFLQEEAEADARAADYEIAYILEASFPTEGGGRIQ